MNTKRTPLVSQASKLITVPLLLLLLLFNSGLGQFTQPPMVIGEPSPTPDNAFGFALAAGDFNAKGALDLAVSNLAEKVFVFYGEPSFDATPDLTISSPLASDLPGSFGWALAAGDFNGDGKTDLAVGAPDASTEDIYFFGQVFIYYGSTQFDKKSDKTLGDPSPTDLANFGMSLAAGDVDHDGLTDLIVGESGTDMVWVFFGAKGTFGQRKLNLVGIEEFSFFGAAVAARDVNGDGTDDIVVGAPYATVGDVQFAGAAYVYFGGKSINKKPDLTIQSPDVTRQDQNFASSIALGDVNGDAKADIVIGAASSEVDGVPGAGKVYVFFGGPNLDATPDLTLQDPMQPLGSGFGYSVAAADLNRDGVADIVVGAGSATVGNRKNAGRVFVFFGGASLDDVADASLDPPTAEQDGVFGSALLGADLDKDNVQDLIVGSTGATAKGKKRAGQVYVYFDQLQQSFLLTVTLAGSGSGTVTSTPAGINCGSDCSKSFASGTTVKLTAAPAWDSTFVAWSGDSDCSDGTVAMDANKTCTATFNAKGTGTIQVKATSNNKTWSGSLAFTLDGPTTLNGSSVPATFRTVPAGMYTLTYNSGGPSGTQLTSIAPSASQRLSMNRIITFTLKFIK